jgi:phospholipase/carboxylesterase
VLVGFSQGGAMALRYGLPRPAVFAGVAVLSGSLRRLNDLGPGLPVRRTQPLFVAHGRADEMIPVEVCNRLVSWLKDHGYRPEHRLYPMGHHILPALVNDLRRWLHAVLPPHPGGRPASRR